MTKKQVAVSILAVVGVSLGIWGALRDLGAAAAGWVGGACVGAGAGLVFRATGRKRGHGVVRVDGMPEPLTTGKVVYEARGGDPLFDWKQFGQYQKPEDLRVVDGYVAFSTPVRSRDDWDYVYLDPARYGFRGCAWSLKFRRNTTFREYAFNFRYQDFDNRYRYRFEDDKIFFDKKVSGIWTNNIASCPFPMKLGEWYDLRIDVVKSLCRCYVNGELRMENTDTDLDWGSVCIILWEDDGETPISADVSKSEVFEIG